MIVVALMLPSGWRCPWTVTVWLFWRSDTCPSTVLRMITDGAKVTLTLVLQRGFWTVKLSEVRSEMVPVAPLRPFAPAFGRGDAPGLGQPAKAAPANPWVPWPWVRPAVAPLVLLAACAWPKL